MSHALSWVTLVLSSAFTESAYCVCVVVHACPDESEYGSRGVFVYCRAHLCGLHCGAQPLFPCHWECVLVRARHKWNEADLPQKQRQQWPSFSNYILVRGERPFPTEAASCHANWAEGWRLEECDPSHVWKQSAINGLQINAPDYRWAQGKESLWSFFRGRENTQCTPFTAHSHTHVPQPQETHMHFYR